MRRAPTHVIRSLVAAFAATAFLSACAGGVNTSAPTAGTAAQTPAEAFAQTGSNALAGQYSGPAVDTVFGTGKLKASFAQSNGAVGGWITTTYQKASMTFSLAGTYAKSSVAGVDVATINKVACAFAYSGKYDSSTHTLSVEYHAAHGCNGESGTLTLNKACYYQESLMQDSTKTPALRFGVNPDANGLHGC
jgi:hypothetical protein